MDSGHRGCPETPKGGQISLDLRPTDLGIHRLRRFSGRKLQAGSCTARRTGDSPLRPSSRPPGRVPPLRRRKSNAGRCAAHRTHDARGFRGRRDAPPAFPRDCTLRGCKYLQSTSASAPRGSQLHRHSTARIGCRLWPWVSVARLFFIFYGRNRSAAVDCCRRSALAVRRTVAIERLIPQRSRVEKNSDTARHPDAKRNRQRQDGRAG